MPLFFLDNRGIKCTFETNLSQKSLIMKCENIAREFEQLAALAASWSAKGATDEIERDIVLAKLAAIYEQIKFANVEPQQQPAAEVPVSVPVSERAPEPQPEPVLEPEPQVVPDDIFIIEPLEFEAASEPHIEIESIVEEASCNAEYVSEELPQVQEFEVESHSQTEFVEDEDIAIVDLSAQEEPEAVAHAQNLFNDDFVVTTKRKVDRSVILSLYGDDSSPRIEVVTDRQVDVEPEPIVLQKDNDIILGIDAAVLGESFTPAQSVADLMSSTVNIQDVASSISTQNTKELRGAIGLNDKFLMIRDVFAGDAAEYEIAIETLEKFDNLDDAMLYLYDNHNQNPNSDGAKLLVELLTRKLS